MGEQIGEIGITGNASRITGDNVHLHFEIGTELRTNNATMIEKTRLKDANLAYKNV